MLWANSTSASLKLSAVAAVEPADTLAVAAETAVVAAAGEVDAVVASSSSSPPQAARARPPTRTGATRRRRRVRVTFEERITTDRSGDRGESAGQHPSDL